MAHLLFVPGGDYPGFFLWGAASPSSAPGNGVERALAAKGEAREAWVAGPSGAVDRTRGVGIGLLKALGVLAAVPMDQVGALSGSLGVWSAASKLALELTARGRFAPRIHPREDRTAGVEARWEVSLADRRDAERFVAIARAMPPAAHAVPLGAGQMGLEAAAPRGVKGREGRKKQPPLWPGDALLYAFLSAAVDALVRASVALRVRSTDAAEALANRSKCSHQRADLSIKWELRFVYALISEDGALALAAPEEQHLPDAIGAWSAPAFLAADGQAEKAGARVRVRMRLGGGASPAAGGLRDRSGETDGIDLSGALRFRWEVTLDGAALRAEEARALLKRGSPPASLHESLAAHDEATLGAALRLVAQGSGLLPARAALRALLLGRVTLPGLPCPAEVVADGALAACLEALAGRGEGSAPAVAAALKEAPSPGLERGIAWLARRASLGLGGWFVDEDGQARRLSAIALLLHLLHLAQARPQPSRSRKPADPPPLVICADPAAWEAAVARAAPPLVPALHCGPERATSPAELKARAAGRGLVLTSYEELSIDADLLGAVEWPMILFDEADAWVSPSSGLRSAAQKLRARCRIGLAGAAIDRRLTSLWAALELVSPGLLGSLEAFQREIALPLERFRDAEAEALLARVVRLLVFRAAEPAPEAAADAPHAHPAEEVGG